MRPRDVFDTVAEAYQRYRPSYPAAAFDDIVAFLDAAGGGRTAVESGAGTGLATQGLVERGFSVLCVEPGPRLAALLRSRFRERPVVVVETDFERFTAASPADLVMAAQSFHFVDRAAGLQVAATTLRPGGVLALMWNRPVPGNTPVEAAIDRVYEEWAPALRGRGGSRTEIEEAVAGHPRFTAMETRTHPWTQTFAAPDYVGLIGTYSDHVLLPAAVREGLFRGVAHAIEENGGVLDSARETYLLLARTRA